METHEREPTEGKEQTVEGGVVLRFPGNWVGSLDELVPFGPSADREDAEPALDFWGEDSAAVQDAIDLREIDEPRPERIQRREPILRRAAGKRMLVAGAVIAAILLGTAAVIGSQTESTPRVQKVTFAIASIPPIARSKRPGSAHRLTQRAASSRRHARSTAIHRRAAGSSRTTNSGSATGGSSSSTSAPSSHPATSTPASGGSNSQGGGAFTLGGP